MKHFLKIFLSIFVAFALAGCASANEDARDSDTVIVTMPKSSEPEAGFDPIYGWGCGEHLHEPLIQSSLVKTTSDMTIENDLATNYTISDDGLTITFEIRDDAKFSNGDKLTAEDVAFTLNQEVANVNNAADFSSIKSTEATSDTECVVTLNAPDNTVLYLLAVTGIVEESTYSSDTYGSNPIGSGRYKLTSWTKGERAVLEVNENYYGDAPEIKKVIVLFMDEDASIAAARAGEVDVAYTSATYASTSIDGYELNYFSTVDSRGISLPTNEGVTSDFAVRYAMNLATDRTWMVQSVLNGAGNEAYSVCDSLPWGSSEMQIETNLEEAKRVLDEAGWVEGDDGVREIAGVKCEFNLYYSASDSVRQALAYEFANEMAQIGIKVNTIGASWGDIYDHEYSDAVLWGWGSNSPYELIQVIKSDGTCNYPQYTSEEADALIAEAISETNIEDSYGKLIEAQSYCTPEKMSSWIWLVNVDHLYFVRDGINVADQKIHPHGHGWSLLNNVDTWSVAVN